MKKILKFDLTLSKSSKVYKNKKLNNANFSNFTHNDYQVFLHLISKIKKVDNYGKILSPNEMQREHILTAKEFHEIFKIQINNCYTILKDATDKLMKTDIRIEMPEKKEIWRINVCSMAKYNKTEGNITIEFTDRIMPYLARVTEKFVLYNLKEIANFKSLHTTRLYELIQEFQDTGTFTKSIDQLKEIFTTGDKLKLYTNFKLRTFGHACKEINDNYNMDLNFIEIKEGRKVVAIEFFFKKTNIEHRVDQQGNPKNAYIKPTYKVKNCIKSSEKKLPLKQNIEIVTQNLQIEQAPVLKVEPQNKQNIGSFISNLFFKK